MVHVGSLCDHWFEARARLSHDFLQNKVLMALSSLEQDGMPHTSAKAYLRLFLLRQGEVRSLLLTAPVALDPGWWFLEESGQRFAPESALALCRFASLMFHLSGDVPKLVQEGMGKLDIAIDACRAAIADDTVGVSVVQAAAFAIQDLARQLAVLPSSREQMLSRGGR